MIASLICVFSGMMEAGASAFVLTPRSRRLGPTLLALILRFPSALLSLFSVVCELRYMLFQLLEFVIVILRMHIMLTFTSRSYVAGKHQTLTTVSKVCNIFFLPFLFNKKALKFCLIASQSSFLLPTTFIQIFGTTWQDLFMLNQNM